MKRILSPLIGWVWMVGCSLVPLSGVHWVEQSGCYLSSSESHPESSHLYDRQVAKAELRFPELNEGEVVLEAHHPCHLLPRAVKDWLLRLGTVAPHGNRLKIRQKLSISCVVHQPCQEESFATSERLWYRNDIPYGEAAILFISLSRGRISLSTLADYSFDGLRRASLPNGFVKRMFPFGLRDAPDWFFTRISGADDRQPFAFASLAFCPRQRQVSVAIEIIPPTRAVLNNIQAVEDLLKRFTNARHPCWQDHHVTVVDPRPAPQAPVQPERNAPQPPSLASHNPTPRIIPPSDLKRRLQIRRDQEALADFACPPRPLPPEVNQRLTLPQGTPFVDENDLAQIIADVLLEDIETYGDPELEIIWNGVLEEALPPPMDFPAPPDIVPNDLVTPPDLPPVRKPQRPSTEPHLPPIPCEYGRPPAPSDDERAKIMSEEGDVNNELRCLKAFEGPIERRNDLIFRSFCPCRPWYNHDIWADANNCPWEHWRHEAARRRLQVREIEDRIARYEARTKQFQQRVDAFNKICNDWKGWCDRYNPQIDEYNRRLRSENEHIQREQREYVERLQRESKQWVEQVQQERKQWVEQIEHHTQRWLEWAFEQGRHWVERIEQARQQRNEKILQKFREWQEQIAQEERRRCNQPESIRQQWREQVEREKQKWLEQIEQEGRKWSEHVNREVQQWNERIERLRQQWFQQHERLIQRWNERVEQLAQQWHNREAQADPQWYEQIKRECREWRNQPAREWREWSEQHAREAQQMREQVERDRQQIQKGARQDRQKQVETYLAGRAANLLEHTYARAQYCVASTLPVPSARPAQQPAASSRPRAPSPPPMETTFHIFENALRVDGHQNFLRTRIRRLLRDTIGINQKTAQKFAEKVDSLIDLGVIYAIKTLCCQGPVGIGGAVAVGVIERDRVIRSTWHLQDAISKKISGKVLEKTKVKIVKELSSM